MYLLTSIIHIATLWSTSGFHPWTDVVLIYMIDLPRVCKMYYLLYLLMTCAVVSHENFSTQIPEANKDLSSISKWFQMNNFVKATKCTKERAKIIIDKIEITHVPYTKFLGVIVDEKLTRKYHIDLFSAKSKYLQIQLVS